MENLIIEPSVKTPTINFYADNGILEIKGKSIPENSTLIQVLRNVCSMCFVNLKYYKAMAKALLP